jgi:hypothetical protein
MEFINVNPYVDNVEASNLNNFNHLFFEIERLKFKNKHYMIILKKRCHDCLKTKFLTIFTLPINIE